MKSDRLILLLAIIVPSHIVAGRNKYNLDLVRAIKTEKLRQDQLRRDQEKAIILEIRDLFVRKEPPAEVFNKWIETRVPVLEQSTREPIRNMGAIFRGNVGIFALASTFEAAIQLEYPDFKISLYRMAKLMPTGRDWYFAKKDDASNSDAKS